MSSSIFEYTLPSADQGSPAALLLRQISLLFTFYEILFACFLHDDMRAPGRPSVHQLPGATYSLHRVFVLFVGCGHARAMQLPLSWSHAEIG